MREHCSKTSARFLIWSHFQVADWWTRAILSNPKLVARGIHGEKGGTGIEASLSYPIRVPRPSPLRALPKIRIPLNPLTAGKLVRRKISCDPSLGNLQVHKVHSTDIKNGSRRLNESRHPHLKVIDPEQNTFTAPESRSERLTTPSSLKPRSIRGLMMKSCT